LSLTPDDILKLYQRYNFRLLYWDRKGSDPKDWKGPHGVEAKGWNDPQRLYPIENFDPSKMNLGTFTGHEIEPGKFLVDIDLDWAAGVVLARRLLPPTNFAFTRKGKSLSHALYTTPSRLDILTYCDLTDDGTDGNGQTFVELRGGNSSRMTMIAPSLHSPGIFIEVVDGSSIAHLEVTLIEHAVLDYAIGCLLLRRLPGGLHHDGRMALAGFLLKNGFSSARVINLMEAVCEAQYKAGLPDMSAGDVGDVTLVVASTEQRIKDKEKKVAGGPKFAEYCGTRGKDIVNRIRKWMGTTAKVDGLILNPAEPMRAARIFVETKYTADAAQSLYNQNAVFYRWAPPAYKECEEPTMRAELWKYLDEALAWSGGKEPTIGPYQPNSAKVSNVLDALRGVTNLSMERQAPCWLENDPGLLPLDIVACGNGLLHVPTRKLVKPTADFFTVNGLNYDYTPEAPEPTHWLKFLNQLWEEDPEPIQTLQEMFGYLLCPDTRFQKIFMMIGPKRSGKSLIGRILAKLVGEQNMCAPSLSSFGKDDFGKQPLVGKSLALIADARISGRVDTSSIAETLLAVSGEDPQTVNRKYLPAWNGKLTTRFVIITNELPRMPDMSGALASRFIIMLLTKSFFGKEDLDLFNRIEPELPGILNWALEGRDRLYARKYFVQPKASEELLQEFADLSSPTQAFLREATVGPEKDGWIATDDLFKLWKRWSMESGIQHAGTAQNFGKSVRAAIPYVTMKQRGGRGEQKKVWWGIKLTEEWAMKLNDETEPPPDHGGQPPLEDM
jgi:putative DNA primase/helicase